MRSIKDIYVQYAQYNLWANKRMSQLFEDLNDELANKTIPGSFPSVQLTVLHIWDAEQVWISRLRHKPIYTFPSKDFSGNFSDARNGMIRTSEEFLQLVETSPPPFFEEIQQFSTITQGEYRHSNGDMIHHCMNHSTYHRGQLIVMARQLGLSPVPSTDMIYFLRKKQAETRESDQ